MPTTIAGRSTRMEVLELLRRKGHASAETISSDLGVTPNAVRQHLTNLERDGFVVSHPERSGRGRDRKSTRLNSSHSQISYAVFCLKKKKKRNMQEQPVKNEQNTDI